VGGILRILFNHGEGSRLRAKKAESRGDHRPEERASLEAYVRLTVVNVSLFPLLFFFSALYYTDGISALSVLVSYRIFLQGIRHGNQLQAEPNAGHGAWRSLAIIASGLVSLTFRQTNIFWVSFFLAGLDVVRTVKALAHFRNKGEPQEAFSSSASLQEILLVSWRTCHVYDPCVSDAALFGAHLANSWGPLPQS
jgi:alpha-1,2-glucosyltransferase